MTAENEEVKKITICVALHASWLTLSVWIIGQTQCLNKPYQKLSKLTDTYNCNVVIFLSTSITSHTSTARLLLPLCYERQWRSKSLGSKSFTIRPRCSLPQSWHGSFSVPACVHADSI